MKRRYVRWIVIALLGLALAGLGRWCDQRDEQAWERAWQWEWDEY